MKSKESFRYVPELDGMRGLAISAVMIFHAGALKGGFIGVDIFFVLSGFLITTLLVQEFKTRQRVDLRAFYLRRALRLAPALILMLASFSFISILVLDGDKQRSNLIDTFIALFYFTNWARAFQIHPPTFLGHTWSLSIEEQFYIVWPIILITLLRFRQSRRHLLLAVSVLALSAWFLRTYLAVNGSSVDRLFNGLDTRADALLVGCLLGLILSLDCISEHQQHRLANMLKVIAPLGGITLVFIGIFADWEDVHMYYEGLFVVELLTAIVILDIFVSPTSLNRKLLSTKLFVWIGRVSYGLYLWHYPIYSAMRSLGFHGPEIITIGSIVTFLVAFISYYSLERPFLKLKKRFDPNASDSSLWLATVPASLAAATEAER